MREMIKPWTPRRDAQRIVDAVNAVLDDFDGAMSLRQVFYQLVTQNVIRNTQKEYDKLGTIVKKARYAGLVDWDSIEDRGRVPRRASEFEGVDDLLDAALQSYRLPRWETQPAYGEIWTEKDALSSVLWPITKANHMVMQVNKGYASASAMYEASRHRFADAAAHGKELVILYLGDLDPSGEDMVLDIEARFDEFGVDVDVRKIALTREDRKSVV